MGSSARIDELRKKFDENPRRYFAPLANEYRKAGDLEQAIFICQEYLPQQPGHMSGHIVYGQALFEQSRFDEARAVFETALSLDPENLIALRHLGDISRQAGDLQGARSWYQRVLEADPRNEEIAEIMQTVLSTPHEPQVAVDEANVDAMATTLELPTSDVPDTSPLGVEKSPEADFGTTLAAPLAPPAEVAAPVFEPASETVRRSRETIPEDELLDLDDFEVGGTPLSSLVVPASEPIARETEPAPFPAAAMPGDVILELSGDDSSDSSLTSAGALEGLESYSDPSFNVGGGTSSLNVESFYEVPPVIETPAAEASESPAAEAFVTETMAELYEKQGHPEAALEIYQRLAEQRPADENLRDKIQTVSDAIAAADKGAPLPELTAPVTAAAGGQTIREFLAGLFQPRGLADAPAAPTAPLPEPIDSDFDISDPTGVEATADASDPVVDLPFVDVGSDEPTAEALEPLEPLAIERTSVEESSFVNSAFDDVAFSDVSPEPVNEDVSVAATENAAPDVASEFETPEFERTDFETAEFEIPAEPPRAAASAADTVSGSIDALFSGADASSTDASAASTLAEAFGSSDRPEVTPLEGVPAHRATNELSLDHVFKTNSAPRQQAEADGFSFDQFFAEELTETASSSRAETPSTNAHVSDDIAQFNNWLNGLKKT